MLERDDLGRIVRQAWIAWAEQQPNPKPSWLVPYDELCEADKEADRMIGSAVAQAARARAEAAETRIVELVIVGDMLHTLARHADTCGLRHGSHCTCALAAWERLTGRRT